MIPDIHNTLGEKLDTSYHPGNKTGKLVILGHGVTGDKDRPLLVALADGLCKLGWPCLRISFSGNGASGGAFEESCISKESADLRSVLDALPPETSVAYAGHSMGGAVGVVTAAVDQRIRVLISLAGMTHTADFVEREFGEVVPGMGFMWDDEACPLSQTYVDDLRGLGSTLAAASEVTQPWLFIHGSADDVVPPGDGEDAHAAAVAAAEKEWLLIPETSHSFDESTYPVIVAAMDRWLSRFL